LEGEITDHLGCDKHDQASRNGGNFRNGTHSKTVLTGVGPVPIDVPRDRSGSFEPQIVRERQRRLSGAEDMVLSLSAKGLTTGVISAHLAEVYGTQVSKQTISTITDKVMGGMAERQNRPVYPVIFLDAVHVRIRDGKGTNRPIYVALAVTVDSTRDMLACGPVTVARARSSGSACPPRWRNGVWRMCMVVCDGPTTTPTPRPRPRRRTPDYRTMSTMVDTRSRGSKRSTAVRAASTVVWEEYSRQPPCA
jgi:hypothetical protein